ncbi:MAG: porin, partial [Betaproteobacteria bacterium]|nr:porin [Betaproteobacteria bacterium]
MQKKIIALAVAGLASTAAFADTNVQIYGILDMGIGHSQNSYNQSSLSPGGSSPIANAADKYANTGVTGMFNGGMSASRIGLKGSEDLGNGLKAVFKLETG